MRVLGESLRHEVLLVWDARRLELGAAKVMRPCWEEREADLGKLRREGEILARLEHPVFPRCLDLALDGPRPHLLLEVAEGPNLREVLARQPYLPLLGALPLGERVASGLAHLASHGLVHADVTPENVVAGVRPFLIDLSRAREAQTAGQASRAKPGGPYRPPEQCAPSPERGPIGPPADVFGLGATLFHVLTGRAPFPHRKGGDPPQLTRRPAPFVRPLPRALRGLLLEMLDRDPAARPDAAEVAVRLTAAHERAERRHGQTARGLAALARLRGR